MLKLTALLLVATVAADSHSFLRAMNSRKLPAFSCANGNAPSTPSCAGAACAASDFSPTGACCRDTCAVGTAAGVGSCPTTTHVAKANAVCAGSTCLASEYLAGGACCDARATCSTGAGCGTGALVNQGTPTTQLCAGATCAASDYLVTGNCCEARALPTACAGKYVSTVGSVSSTGTVTDPLCSDYTSCCAGTAVTGNSQGDFVTLGAAGMCAACAAGKFSASGTEATGACCANKKTCAATEYVSALGSLTTDLTCATQTVCTGTDVLTGATAGDSTTLGTLGTCQQNCAAGTAATPSVGSCTGVAEAKANQATINCAAAACVAGDYASTAPYGTCCQLKASGCTATQYVSAVGTATTNPTCLAQTVCCAGTAAVTGFSQGDFLTLGAAGTCAACAAGKFSASGTEVDGACCANKKTCAATEYVSALGSATTDLTCATQTVCTGTDVITGATAGDSTTLGTLGTCLQTCAAGTAATPSAGSCGTGLEIATGNPNCAASPCVASDYLASGNCCTSTAPAATPMTCAAGMVDTDSQLGAAAGTAPSVLLALTALFAVMGARLF